MGEVQTPCEDLVVGGRSGARRRADDNRKRALYRNSLWKDHCVQEPDYESMNGHHRHRENSINDSVDSSDEFYSSPEDEEDFLQKQFSEAYEDVHAERLNSMSKAGACSRTQTGCVDARPPATDSVEQAQQKMAVFRDEIRKLADENALVRKHNRALREVLDTSPAELSAS
ncbi:hypothetical protein MRX96_031818 [Rhipicephalus microplus]